MSLPQGYPELPCPVEGCRYAETDDDGCGLTRVGISAEQGLDLWDAGHPVVRGCFAHRAAEAILADGMIEEAADGS